MLTLVNCLVLNSNTTVTTSTTLASFVTKANVLALLHDSEAMLQLNPLRKSHVKLPSPLPFYKAVDADLKPATESAIEALSVFSVVESSAGTAHEEGAETWRGGWAKRFIPDEITYETSMQPREDGMMALTHAPMGVHSVTTWTVTEEGDGKLVLNKKGVVTSNRMLTGFIKTTLQDSYDKLARDFVEAVERRVKGKGKEVAEEKVVENNAEANTEVEAVS
jgi:hypothetical protein